MILGIVATILSIVSLKTGFDSAENARATELKTQSILDNIDEKMCILTEKQEQMAKSINEMRNNQKDRCNWNVQSYIPLRIE